MRARYNHIFAKRTSYTGQGIAVQPVANTAAICTVHCFLLWELGSAISLQSERVALAKVQPVANAAAIFTSMSVPTIQESKFRGVCCAKALRLPCCPQRRVRLDQTIIMVAMSRDSSYHDNIVYLEVRAKTKYISIPYYLQYTHGHYFIGAILLRFRSPQNCRTPTFDDYWHDGTTRETISSSTKYKAPSIPFHFFTGILDSYRLLPVDK